MYLQWDVAMGRGSAKYKNDILRVLAALLLFVLMRFSHETWAVRVQHVNFDWTQTLDQSKPPQCEHSGSIDERRRCLFRSYERQSHGRRTRGGVLPKVPTLVAHVKTTIAGGGNTPYPCREVFEKEAQCVNRVVPEDLSENGGTRNVAEAKQVSSMQHRDWQTHSFLSRQYEIYGPHQKSLSEASVLIVGLTGPGVEAAKCLVLGGVGRIILADPNVPDISDASDNFAVAGAWTSPKFRNPEGTLLEMINTKSQISTTNPLTRGELAYDSLRRLAMPHTSIELKRLDRLDGDLQKWQQRVHDVLKTVDVVVLADRPLNQVYFFDHTARHIQNDLCLDMKASRIVSNHREEKSASDIQMGDRASVNINDTALYSKRSSKASRRRGPLIISVWAAGLCGRMLLDFGSEYSFQKTAAQWLSNRSPSTITQTQPFNGGTLVSERASLSDTTDDTPQRSTVRHETLQNLLSYKMNVSPQVSFDKNIGVVIGLAALDAYDRKTVTPNLWNITADADEVITDGMQRDISASPSRHGAEGIRITRHDTLSTVELNDLATLRDRVLPTTNQSQSHTVGIASSLLRPLNLTMFQGKYARQLSTRIIRTAFGRLAPIASIMGALAAQEALKGITRCYSPAPQMFLFEALDSIDYSRSHQSSHCRVVLTHSVANISDSSKSIAYDSGADTPSNEDYRRDFTYWGQRRVIGDPLQLQLNQMRVFLIGAGAIGCEMLKNFALMGVGCTDHRRSRWKLTREWSLKIKRGSAASISRESWSMWRRLMPWSTQRNQLLKCHAKFRRDQNVPELPGGWISVADADVVEKSNLNRQLLFTVHDLHRSKARASAAAIRRLNRNVVAVPFGLSVERDNEDVFDAEFWRMHDVAAVALDTVAARMYVDSLCLLHAKPMIEAGTHGLQGHAQSIIPHLTESYESSAPPEEEKSSIPICSVKGIPTSAVHTVHWAHALFSAVYESEVQEVAQILNGISVFGPRKSLSSWGCENNLQGYPELLDIPNQNSMLGMWKSARISMRQSSERNHNNDRVSARAPATAYDIVLISELYNSIVEGLHPTLAFRRLHRVIVRWALRLFREIFYEQPRNLANSENGDSLSIKTVRPLQFDPEDGDMMEFVTTSSRLLWNSLFDDNSSGKHFENECEWLWTTGGVRTVVGDILREEYERTWQNKHENCVSCKRIGSKHRSELVSLRDGFSIGLSNFAKTTGLLHQSDLKRSVHAHHLPLLPKPTEFDKDALLHLKFLTAAARLRSRCFSITPLPSIEEAQHMLGKIIPATATASSIAAALACLEMYKIAALKLGGYDPQHAVKADEVNPIPRLEALLYDQADGTETCTQTASSDKSHTAYLYFDGPSNGKWSRNHVKLRNTFFNLGVPFMTHSSPLTPLTTRFRRGVWRGQGFTPWQFLRLFVRHPATERGSMRVSETSVKRTLYGQDRNSIEAAEAVTVGDLVCLLECALGVKVLSLSCGSAILYSNIAMPPLAGDLVEPFDPESGGHIRVEEGDTPHYIVTDKNECLATRLRRALHECAPANSDKANDWQKSRDCKEGEVYRQEGKSPQKRLVLYAVDIMAVDPNTGEEVTVPQLNIPVLK